MTLPEVPTKSFVTAGDFRMWLEDNHKTSQGIWVRFFKKMFNVPSVTYDEAVEAGLCYGWIDSQVKKYDEQSYLQKFTPRRSKSIWSKINREKVERLIAEGKMRPAGLAQMQSAKEDGRWDKAYDSPSTMTIPEDFLHLLAQNKKAKSFYESLNRTNMYAIAWRIQTAKKPETRARRIQKILEMLSNGEKFHD